MDPCAALQTEVELEPGQRTVIGDGRMQTEVDLGRAAAREALNEFSERRLQRILDWQSQINLSVLPLSAGEETLA